MDEEIRPPDQTVRECLVTNNYYQHTESEEDQLRRILEESETEYEFQFAILESKRIEQEREERAKHFAGFRSKIAQFMRIDVPNRSFYSELLGYIDKYESGEIVTTKVSMGMKYLRCLDQMKIRVSG
jgi:hypothetical protein